MDDAKKEQSGENRAEGGEATRPQQGGEAPTTRFGMEDGDNTDVQATGLGSDEEDEGRQAE